MFIHFYTKYSFLYHQYTKWKYLPLLKYLYLKKKKKKKKKNRITFPKPNHSIKKKKIFSNRATNHWIPNAVQFQTGNPCSDPLPPSPYRLTLLHDEYETKLLAPPPTFHELHFPLSKRQFLLERFSANNFPRRRKRGSGRLSSDIHPLSRDTWLAPLVRLIN